MTVTSLQPRSKVWLLGASAVGKTSMVQSLLTNSAIHSKNYRQTQTPELSVYKQKLMEMFILDVAGDEVYSDITDIHLARHDASSIVICYDVTNKSSLTNLKRWMNHWRNYDKSRSQHTGLLPVAIVGLKSDLTNRRLITSKQGENLVQKLKNQSGLKNIKYFEASCKKPGTVVEVFNWLGESINKLNNQQQTRNVIKMMDDPVIE